MATVEERVYQYTELVYLDDNGVFLGSEDLNDTHWYDTASVRVMTAEERTDWGLPEEPK